MAVSASLSASPQAIVFDFGGVMTRDANREAAILFTSSEQIRQELTQRKGL